MKQRTSFEHFFPEAVAGSDAERITALEKQNAELLAALKEVAGCFAAAEVEGLTAILYETTDNRLKDLVERRLLWANEAAAKILAALQPSTQEVSRPRLIPDVECKQGKCACTTTGCWGKCSLVISQNQEVSK